MFHSHGGSSSYHSVNHGDSSSPDTLKGTTAPKTKETKLLTVAVIDFVSVLILWFAAGTSYEDYQLYLDGSIKDFTFQTSLFDVFLVGVVRAMILVVLALKLTRFKSAAVHIFSLLLTAGSFIFVLVKTILVFTNEGVLGGTLFAGFILGTQLLFTLFESYRVAVVKKTLLQSEYAPIDSTTAHEKAEESRKNELEGKGRVSFGRLLILAKPEIKILSVAMVALFITSLSQAALPFIFGVLVDALVEGEKPVPCNPDDPTGFFDSQAISEFVGLADRTPEESLNFSILLLLILFAVSSLFGLIRGWLFTLAGQRVVARLRKDVFSAVVTQEVGFFDRTRTGDLTSRLTSDTQVIQNAVTTNISMLVRYLVSILISVVILVILSWQLSLVMFSVVPVVAIGAVIYGRYVQRLQKEFQDNLAAATSVAEEVISNIRTVRAFSKEARSQALYGDAIHKTYLTGRTIAMAYGIFQGVLGFIPQCAIALILWYGGTLVLRGEITTGLLTSFLLYTLSVAMSFAFLSSLYGDFMQAVGASSKIFQLLDRVPEIPTAGGDKLIPMKGHVEFKDVSFHYPTRPDITVLKSIALALQPGKVLALVGPSGGGKTTVVALMERFYDVTQGEVLIDGVNLKTLDPEWYRQNVALVSQEPVLFANTIKENICYGIERQVTLEEVEAAAKAANAHSFITGFTEGYETQVGERGVRLSGGQKQRIAIARALLMNPKILLLDEATSALDAESEYLVQDAIEKAMKGRTVLVIAHRLSTVKNSDIIAVLAGGTIMEAGSHDELLEKDGLYKKLVSRQMQTGKDTMQEVFADMEKEIRERQESEAMEKEKENDRESEKGE